MKALRRFDVLRKFPGIMFPEGAEYSIFLDDTVKIGSGTYIYPGVVLEGKTSIGKNSRIMPGCHITDSTVGENCTLGGEIKRCYISDNVAAKHGNGYLGDTTIASGVNIGSGVVTANFDGAEKKKTFIGEDSFIGVGVILIAKRPALHIGSNVFIAAGITIRDDVPCNTFVKPVILPSGDVVFRENKIKKIGKKWIRQE